MKLKTLAAAAALLATGLASATTLNAGAYSITYDETTPGFGSISNWGSGPGDLVSFEWSLQSPVNLTSADSSPLSFALPDFTITANSGWTLSGTFTASIGNVTYLEFGTASTDLAAGGTVTIDANPAVVVPLTSLSKVSSGPNTGWFAGSVAVPTGMFNTLSVSNGSLMLTATASGLGSFAAIVGQPQNKLKFEFHATELPVPEPETYALLLGGLGVVSLIARRRRQPR